MTSASRSGLLCAVVIGLCTFVLFGCAPNRMYAFQRHLRGHDYQNALDLIRAEIRAPRSRQSDYLFDVYIWALRAITADAKYRGVRPETDQEVEDYHRMALTLVQGASEKAALLDMTMAGYYSDTYRHGRAIAHIHAELDALAAAPSGYRALDALDRLATCYGEVGQFLLEDHYRRKLLRLAESYYDFGIRPADDGQWRGLIGFVKNRMADLARQADAPQIKALWKKLEPVVWKYADPQYAVYLAVSRDLAEAGDIETSLQLYRQAQEVARQEKSPYAQTGLACTGAEVFSLAGNGDRAADLAGTCFQLCALRGMDPGPEAYRVMGSIQAQKGNLGQAIDHFQKSISTAERTRGSYAVKERAAFFKSAIRRSYWGLIACLARQATQTRSRKDFWKALEASEMVRARQFGEMMADKVGNFLVDLSPDSLPDILRADEILLSYLLTDENIVLLACTRQWWGTYVLPYDKHQFRRLLLAIADDLSNPSSSQAVLDERIAPLSRQLLDPVRAQLVSKRRVVVLTDGILDVLPFDLLILDTAAYRPLILDKIVSRAPSLRYLVRMRQQPPGKPPRGFFAVADPAYGAVPAVEHLSAEELRGLTPETDYSVFFSPLPETNQEVTRIAEMFAGEPVTLLTREKASETNLKAADLRSYGTLHFATHGILADDLPIVDDPALALSPETDQDGFFTAGEAAQLNLDAALTVLSACNTGRGEYLVGEGIMGLSRAFLLAGSRNVIMTLWSIPSEATMELMLLFYEHYRTGLDPSEALRMAKLQMLKAPPAEHVIHPFFWAAFVLIGA